MAAVQALCASVLEGLDEELVEYIAGMVESLTEEGEDITEPVSAFLLSCEFADDEAQAEALCARLAAGLSSSGAVAAAPAAADDAPRLLDAPKQMGAAADDEEAMAYMWRMDEMRKTINTTFDAHDGSNRKARRQRRQQEAAERGEAAGGDSDDEAAAAAAADGADVAMPEVPDAAGWAGTATVHITGIDLQFKGQTLLSDAELHLHDGHRYGLIGRNGVGKTTLLKRIAAYDLEGFPRYISILHVAQEVRSTPLSVIQTVLRAHTEMHRLKREAALLERRLDALHAAAEQPPPPPPGPEAVLEADHSSDLPEEYPELARAVADMDEEAAAARMQAVWSRLRELDADTAEARAQTILHGLGFDAAMVNGPTSALSGGWRMRVAIACALHLQPDLLLLDEPTNHLDLEAVVWLTDYLATYPKTLLVVSHDRNFLNGVITHVMHFAGAQLTPYTGNYDVFERERANRVALARRRVDALNDKMAHMQAFIDRFRFNANRAALVQSRVKAVEKLRRERDDLGEPEDLQGAVRFDLGSPDEVRRPAVVMSGVTFGYSPDKILFREVDFSLGMDSRVGVLGRNGIGKSTLIKLIKGDLTPLDGNVQVTAQMRTAVFTQHHIDQLDLTKTPLENLAAMYPGLTDDAARSHLARFHVPAELATKLTRKLSGGQKSRVAFAALTLPNPHVIIFDEPTNHLDLDAVQSLIDAVKAFAGGILVVSHDTHFVKSVANDLCVIDDGRLTNFRGSFDDYRARVLAQAAS